MAFLHLSFLTMLVCLSLSLLFVIVLAVLGVAVFHFDLGVDQAFSPPQGSSLASLHPQVPRFVLTYKVVPSVGFTASSPPSFCGLSSFLRSSSRFPFCLASSLQVSSAEVKEFRSVRTCFPGAIVGILHCKVYHFRTNEVTMLSGYVNSEWLDGRCRVLVLMKEAPSVVILFPFFGRGCGALRRAVAAPGSMIQARCT